MEHVPELSMVNLLTPYTFRNQAACELNQYIINMASFGFGLQWVSFVGDEQFNSFAESAFKNGDQSWVIFPADIVYSDDKNIEIVWVLVHIEEHLIIEKFSVMFQNVRLEETLQQPTNFGQELPVMENGLSDGVLNCKYEVE